MSEQTIGEKIKAARMNAGMKQWQLANKINVSESYIALIESNRRNPSMNVLTMIADALDLTIDSLVLNTDDRSDDSFLREWQLLTQDRSPKEIQSALKLLRSYFECLDEL